MYFSFPCFLPKLFPVQPLQSHYKGVRPLTLVAVSEGERLVIGTQASDALVTSSVRIDEPDKGSVGALTGTFQLLDAVDTTSTRIYLDKESFDLGMALINDANAWRITNSYMHGQLRQFKTKFDDASTYFLCRASGPLTKAHTYRPYSVHTYCNYSRAGDGHLASKLSLNISTLVLKDGDGAVLSLGTVQECRRGCSNESRNIPSVIDSILSLFRNGASTIPILTNRELNGHLETLALLLSSYISAANKILLTSTMQNLVSPK
ncbi:hypothetical protein BGX27_002937 [Mortierella sp. AM989]|nr:hypothetical protein BGX27_002937 [Mortierella sp. AM989]